MSDLEKRPREFRGRREAAATNRVTYLCPTCNYAIPDAAELVSENVRLVANVEALSSQVETLERENLELSRRLGKDE